MKGAIGKQVNSGIVITVAIVLVIVGLSIWQYRRIRNTGVEIRHLDLVLYQTGEIMSTFTQAELNVKNFQLTGDSSFLAVANDSARHFPGKIAQLRELTASEPGITTRLDSIVALYGQGKAPELGWSTTGYRALGGRARPVFAILRGILTDEHQQLDQWRAGNQVRALQLQWALWALSAAVVVLGIAIIRRIRMDLGRAHVAREQSEDRYKTLFFKSPLAKWIYDEATLRFLEVNEAAIRIYGYSAEEFRNLTLADIRPAEDVDLLMTDIREVRRNPESFQTGQWRHRRKNGEVIEVEVTAHPVELDGRRARMVAVVDVTEQRQYERQLEELNTDLHRLNNDMAKRAVELAASNSELERFAYVASHDLQEPLRMVSSFLQLLQKKYGGQLDERADQYIHYAVDGAERMKKLIMDLLEFSRLGTGREAFDWVDCTEVMAEIGEIFREQIVAARARVEIGPLPRVWGDKGQLTQLLQNLVSNALKYASEEPPVIAIRAEVKPACWQFSVADNGIGIDPPFFDKIFIIFQRLHNKNEYSGTGIGLAICKKIVERHGGKIWVESGQETGSLGTGGSTFYFTIGKKT